ncbi:hypothetical protein [Thermococcus sp.]|uniref:coiled-coil domain-containing protein n=1 Tax=Thermococcus sp. TaxID=35749 RepID=UPI002623B377|nr:hypothetical protein [Thermococcus sp.]
MKRRLVAIVVFFVALGLLLSPVSALTTSTNPELPSQIEEKKVVDFTLVITDIHGTKLTIITDLKQDGATPIFDTSNLGNFDVKLQGNKIEISPKSGSFPSVVEVHIHGVVPEGITTKVVQTPTNQRLSLKFFDLGEHIYYRVTDGYDSESKNFVIIHPQLEKVNSIIENNVTDPKAKAIAKEYIDLGLIDFVENDLLPLFVKYDPQTIENLQNKISELQALVEQLNSTLKEKDKKISNLQEQVKSLSDENGKLKSENENLNQRVSDLEKKVKDLQAQLEEANRLKASAQKSAKNYLIATVVLVILVGVVGFAGYRSGKSTGVREAKSKWYKKGYDEGYRRGEEHGYERCMRERSRSLIDEGE